MNRIVVGVGHPDRGDDAVGPLVARRVAEHLVKAPGDNGFGAVRVVEQAAPSELPLLGESVDHLVVVDALRSGRAPGTVAVHDLVADGDLSTPTGTPVGTHALSVADALALAQILGTLPPRVTLVGVEAGGVDVGAGLSPAVAAAVDDAVAGVLRILAAADRP